MLDRLTVRTLIRHKPLSPPLLRTLRLAISTPVVLFESCHLAHLFRSFLVRMEWFTLVNLHSNEFQTLSRLSALATSLR